MAGFFCLVGAVPGFAQGTAWVQLEANVSLAEGEAAARDYAARLEAVNGFRAGRWYVVVLGPFSPEGAEARRAELLARGAIPADAFVSDGNAYGTQWWPVGANTIGSAAIAVPEAEPEAEPEEETSTGATAQDTEVEPSEPEEPEAPAEPEPPKEETVSEARASERALSRDERMALQVALQWAGFYNSGIDGAFGPGTRGAMRAWQEAKGYDATGILTTRQRAEVLGSYQAVIDSLGLETVVDREAGIEMAMPAAMVRFDRYEAPFAHYTNTDGSGVRLVLISQSGNQDTLFGLYDILQTLEIVPLDGPRERRNRDFTIEGSNDEITSYTYAKLSGDAVKGFTLIWPTGDEKRRQLAMERITASFTALDDAVLADTAGLDVAEQSLDLMSGLEIRQPDRNRSGFYVNASGAVLTTSTVVEACGRITLDGIYNAEVVATDNDLGLALLKPVEALAPLGVVSFLDGEARLKSEIAVAGYSYGGRLPSPTLSFGILADVVGLGGEAALSRLDLVAQDGDAGGPVFDGGGAAMGVLIEPRTTANQQLPQGVRHAVDASAAVAFLSANGVTPRTSAALAAMDPVDMSLLAADVTVLVSCWN